MLLVDSSQVKGPPEVPMLTTERLRLKAFDSASVKLLLEVHAHPEVALYFPRPPVSPTTLREIWSSWHFHGFGPWAIRCRQSGRFMGAITLAQPGHHPDPEISWVLDPDYWGRGYATEAAQKVLRHAFVHFRLPALVSTCSVTNRRSQRVIQKLGMRPLFQSIAPEGHVAMQTFSITRHEWEQLQPSATSSSLL